MRICSLFSVLALVQFMTLASEPSKEAAAHTAIVPLKDAKLVIAEDFESTNAGEIPKGFTKKGAASVVTDVAHSGTHSLRLDAAVKGLRGIEKLGPDVTALGGQHWGRMFYKVQLPAPKAPEGKGVHTTLVACSAQSPAEKDPIEVRLMGLSMGAKEGFRYLYNVQPRKGRKEFGVSSKVTQKFSDEWTLAEWYVDHKTQTYKFYINCQELTDVGFQKGENNFAGAEIPAVFESMTFGWNNYQPVDGTGFVVWIDDIAVGKDRIGDQTSVPVKGK